MAIIIVGGFLLQFMCLAALLRPMSYYEKLHADELNALQINEPGSERHNNNDENGNPLLTVSNKEISKVLSR